LEYPRSRRWSFFAGALSPVEVPVSIRPRRQDRSTITVRSIYYLVHVMLGVLVNILIFDRRRWR
jgi:hypothetical protein